jgi:hypothetical protein
MKTLIFMAGLAMFLAACTQSQKVANSIPGIYVNHAESAYSIADDTLVIAENGGTNNYQVTRKTTYQRKADNKLRAPQHKVKNYTAVWDQDKQTLQITQNGTILLFRPDENKLLIENSEYRKL